MCWVLTPAFQPCDSEQAQPLASSSLGLFSGDTEPIPTLSKAGVRTERTGPWSWESSALHSWLSEHKVLFTTQSKVHICEAFLNVAPSSEPHSTLVPLGTKPLFHPTTPSTVPLIFQQSPNRDSWVPWRLLPPAFREPWWPLQPEPSSPSALWPVLPTPEACFL